MCGITGYIGFNNPKIVEATDLIKHRGPDSSGYLSYFSKDNLVINSSETVSDSFLRIYFGFRRLAIIDLNEISNQPFYLPEKNIGIIFNGEIYNHNELRNELISKKYRFISKSDTEVIINAYLEWGKDCVNHLRGMWAFSILDINRKEVFCSRDRFGIKPFYYSSTKEDFYFGSEIKQLFKLGFSKSINENVIRDYLDKSLIDHTNESFFKGVYNLQPGHNLTISFTETSFSFKINKYWDLNTPKKQNSLNNITIANEFKKIFEESIQFHLRSDVEVGSCLSGGLDSSSIVSTAAKNNKEKIKVFNSRFDEKKFDESNYAKMVADKYDLKLHYCSLSPSGVLSQLDKVIFHQDEPFTDFSIMAQWEVMKLANMNGIKVMLDGQGGDELLYGYRKYFAFYIKDLFKEKKYISCLKELYHLLKSTEINFFNKEGIFKYLKRNNKAKYLSEYALSLKEARSIGLNSVKSTKELSKNDIKYLSFPQLLRYEDRNSMAFSIEARVPFVDNKVVEYLYSLPSNQLINSGYTKSVLRDAMENILPEEIRKRRSKLGFSTPQSDWLMSNLELKTFFTSYFSKMNNPYLNNRYIYEEFKKYPKSKLFSTDFSKFLIFDKWYNFNFK
tara:strand:+ start:14842 stop:16692 length:1851 start_codon:yes stop_codon:yes gene_type:complete